MKQKFFFISLLALFFLYSFYEGNKDGKNADAKKASVKTALKPAQAFQSTSNIATGKVGQDSLLKMLACYKSHPLLKDPSTGTTTEYFALDPADWDYLIALHKAAPIKSLLFKLAIKNFDQVNAGTAAPVYTVVTMPVDQATGVSSNMQALDYICPCPGSYCCPPPSNN